MGRVSQVIGYNLVSACDSFDVTMSHEETIFKPERTIFMFYYIMERLKHFKSRRLA